MIDHRRVQRTLFRMQHDPAFAAALRGGEPDAVGSTGLAAPDLALLVAADPAGVEADAEGRRRQQFLGNVASEMLLSTWLAVSGGRDAGLLDSFPASSHFHRCVVEGGRLPLAFAAHAGDRAAAAGDALLSALVELESGMARLRRETVPRPRPEPGEVVLAPRALVVELPSGTHEVAALLKQALDAGAPATPPRLPAAGATERVLLSGREPSASGRLAEVFAEPLSALPGALLVEAERPLGPARRARFCRVHDVEAAELADFVESLVGDGVLAAG